MYIDAVTKKYCYHAQGKCHQQQGRVVYATLRRNDNNGYQMQYKENFDPIVISSFMKVTSTILTAVKHKFHETLYVVIWILRRHPPDYLSQLS